MHQGQNGTKEGVKEENKGIKECLVFFFKFFVRIDVQSC